MTRLAGGDQAWVDDQARVGDQARVRAWALWVCLSFVGVPGLVGDQG
jgi:hypothetical protein